MMPSKTSLMTAAITLALFADFIWVIRPAAEEISKRPRAEDNFKWYCVQCHGPRGDGKGVNNSPSTKLPVSPRNLTDTKDISQFSDQDITRTIKHGGGVNDLSAIMPPWGNVFSSEEIRDLVAHVRKLCRCRFDPKAKERAMKEEGKIPVPEPRQPDSQQGKPVAQEKGTSP